MNIYLDENRKPTEVLLSTLEYYGISLEEFKQMSDLDVRVFVNKFSDVLNNGAKTDSGSFSRYFDLDAWDKGARDTLPFIITPKASKSEKNKGLESFQKVQSARRDKGQPYGMNTNKFRPDGSERKEVLLKKNNHPTVKPVKLFCYLITMFSRAGDLVLDPFVGSGTTLVSAEKTKRKVIGIDSNEQENSCEIAIGRYKGQEKEFAL